MSKELRRKIRYRAEKRFQVYGIVAISLALFFVGLLIVKILLIILMRNQEKIFLFILINILKTLKFLSLNIVLKDKVKIPS